MTAAVGGLDAGRAVVVVVLVPDSSMVRLLRWMEGTRSWSLWVMWFMGGGVGIGGGEEGLFGEKRCVYGMDERDVTTLGNGWG